MITLPKNESPSTSRVPESPVELPPPEFAPYHADFFEIGYEDICSHDPHLNSDGEALYRFLLEHSQRLPFVRVNIKGTHTEHRTRWVTHRREDGSTERKTESYTETIVDFDFSIDISPPYGTKPIQWSVEDFDPAFRGKMVKEVEEVQLPGLGGVRRTKRKALRNESKMRKQWDTDRQGFGLPPWCQPAELDQLYMEFIDGLPTPTPNTSLGNYVDNFSRMESNSLRSSKTLRQWADEYCQSPKHLKEFVYDQQIYGWNTVQIEDAIRATVLATPYNGDLEITFTKHRSRIYIRPDNKLSRMLSNKWLWFLSIILLIFPFIWLFKRFHSRGGGRWKVCGAAYPMKQWVPADQHGEALPSNTDDQGLPDLPAYSAHDGPSSSSSMSPFAFPTPSLLDQSSNAPGSLWVTGPPSSPSLPSSRFVNSPSGPKKLVGIREGEWYRRWEGPIRRAVVGRFQSSIPLEDETYAPPPVATLDGYYN